MSTTNTDNTDNEELSNNMYDIVNTENERLKEKKLNIDQQMESKERLRLLNDNIRKRGEDISSIVIAFVFVLVVFTLLRLAAKRFESIPDYVFEVPNFILVAIGIIYICTIIARIVGRDRLYYDKLIFEKPALDDPEKVKQNHDNAARDEVVNLCQGEICCDPYNDLFYDPDTNKCTYRPDSNKQTAAELERQALLTKQIEEAEERARLESEKRLALEKKMQENKQRREKEIADQKARAEASALLSEQERKRREEEEKKRKEQEKKRREERKRMVSGYINSQLEGYKYKLKKMNDPKETNIEATTISDSKSFETTVKNLLNSNNPKNKLGGRQLKENVDIVKETFLSKIFLNNEKSSYREGFTNDEDLAQLSKSEIDEIIMVKKSDVLKDRHAELKKQKEEEKKKLEEELKRKEQEAKRKREEEARRKREEEARRKREEEARRKREEQEARRKREEEEERKRRAEMDKDRAIKENHKNPNFVFNRVRITHTRKDYLHFSELQVWSKNRNIALYKHGGRASFIKGGTYQDANKAIDDTANKGNWTGRANGNIAHSANNNYPIWELKLPQNVHSMKDLQAIVIYNRMDAQNYGYTERSKGWQISLWKDDKEVYRLPVVDSTNFAYKIKGGRRPHRQKDAWWTYWLQHILHDRTRNKMLIPGNRFNKLARRKRNKVALLAARRRGRLPTGVKVWNLRGLARQKSWLESFVNFDFEDTIESFVSLGFDIQDTIESFTTENFTNLFNYE